MRKKLTLEARIQP